MLLRISFSKRVRSEPIGKGGFKGERLVKSQKLGRYSKKQGRYLGGKEVVKVQKVIPDSMYLKEGYKELREIQGMDVDKINIKYSGNLIMKNYVSGTQGLNTVLLGLTTYEDAKKREGLEARFGPILSGTDEELAVYEQEVNEKYEAFVLRLFKSL